MSASLPRKHVGIVASDPHIADLYTGGGTSVPKREIRIAVTIARADAGYFHESKRSYTGASVTRTTIRFVCQRPTCVYVRTLGRIYFSSKPTDATRRDARRRTTRRDTARRGATRACIEFDTAKTIALEFFHFSTFSPRSIRAFA